MAAAVAARAHLPDALIVGYANWNQCDQGLVAAAENGVNVLIWFSVDLLWNNATGARIDRGPDWECYRRIRTKMDPALVHLISIGGWNSAHPNAPLTGKDWFQVWDEWNRNVVGNGSVPLAFDGIDWDLEGNDDPKSPWNAFTKPVLDVMGEMSQEAKRAGYIVSLAPAESYLDATTHRFDRVLTHASPEYPDFYYHGHNVYAYLLSKYGSIRLASKGVETFDFVTVQFYERFSHILYNTTVLHQPASAYLCNILGAYSDGWWVDFASDPEMELPSDTVAVAPSRLVVGLANAWATNDNGFLFVSQSELSQLWENCQYRARGFAFWDIADEGKDGVYLASILKTIMTPRNKSVLVIQL
ncbi:hypothetical protein HDU91_006864 [Kappamyces sp. JEL0680]|nr:hypothetical protein HDU91_006864 [Kappamyces sp. JEL0680]